MLLHHPMHSPAVAPAVNDDLLAEISEWVYHHADEVPSQDIGEVFVASKVGQRLRAAWTAEKAAEYAESLRHQNAAYSNLGELYDRMCSNLTRERDESYRQKTEWQATAGRIAAERDTLKVKVEVLQIEGDEARAERDSARGLFRAVDGELERLRAAQQTGDLEERLWRVLRESAPHPFPDNLVDAVKQLCDQARAAQQLPDVGPVTRAWPDGYTDGLTTVLPGLVDSYGAAGVKEAIDAYLAAEAADTSSDGEEVRAAMRDAGWHPSNYDHAKKLIDAHRSRGGQEAGQ